MKYMKGIVRIMTTINLFVRELSRSVKVSIYTVITSLSVHLQQSRFHGPVYKTIYFKLTE